ncbi:hypothetical protein LB507_008711 [Fusarium sp. FIESC RH6]|nr:hypothetical protein LB507_008711 [Fusarium sp. FIESC RH6]
MDSWGAIDHSWDNKDLFLKKIYKLAELSAICMNSSFLAVCIKDVEKSCKDDRVLLQVGLAYLPSLNPEEVSRCGASSMSTLIQFYNRKEVQALTLNVHVDQHELNQILKLHDIPMRRNVRFGDQLTVFPEMLNDAVIGFLERCGHHNGRNLVITAYGSSGWKTVRNYFPEVLPHFSAYINVRDILRDAAPDSGEIPKLSHSLELFGFDEELQHHEKSGRKADNAGEHAVAVCALMHLMLSPENQERFKRRLECGLMARRWENKETRKIFASDARFMLSVRTKARGALPYSLDSSWKMAKEFYNWSPKYTVRISNAEAYVQFHDEYAMKEFLNHFKGRASPTGEILDIRPYLEVRNEVQQQDQEWGQQEHNQQLEWCNQGEEQQVRWGQRDEWAPGPGWNQQDQNQHQEEDQPQDWESRELRLYQKEKDQQEEDDWPTGMESKPAEEENEEQEVNGEEQVEEQEDGFHASGWFGDDEKPKLAEDDAAADWDLLSD